ncbi:velvet factor, partial [Dimargaris cristalligena]
MGSPSRSQSPISGSATHGYKFLESSDFGILRVDPSQYQLVPRQQPKQAKVFSPKDKDRRTIEPPPIIQLKAITPAVADNYSDSALMGGNYLQNPYLIMYAAVIPAHNDGPIGSKPTATSASGSASSPLALGTLVSSLHRLKDLDNSDAGFFVFPDIAVRQTGEFRIRYSLYELFDNRVHFLTSYISDVFVVYANKHYPGHCESTFLSRSFSDQGVRIRIRKEHRVKF